MSKDLKQMQVAGGEEMKAVSGPASAPSVAIVKRKHWKIGVAPPSYVAALGLLLLALPSSQPAHALDAISLAGVSKAFETAAPAQDHPDQHAGRHGDRGPARIRPRPLVRPGNESADKADDYAGLRAYAAGLGSDQAGARNGPTRSSRPGRRPEGCEDAAPRS